MQAEASSESIDSCRAALTRMHNDPISENIADYYIQFIQLRGQIDIENFLKITPFENIGTDDIPAYYGDDLVTLLELCRDNNNDNDYADNIFTTLERYLDCGHWMSNDELSDMGIIKQRPDMISVNLKALYVLLMVSKSVFGTVFRSKVLPYAMPIYKKTI